MRLLMMEFVFNWLICLNKKKPADLQSEKSSRIYSSTTIKQSVPKRLSTYFLIREVAS